MQPSNNKPLRVALFILIFAAGISGGYFYFMRRTGPPVQKTGAAPAAETPGIDSPLTIKVYYPSEGRLIMEERVVQKKQSPTAITGKAIEEFLKGPSGGGKSDIPAGARLLGAYAGNDGLLYVDLSDEFRRNFQGSAFTEFLLLKGLYDTIVANVPGIDDVKLTIEGRETESIGGHISILYPVKESLAVSGGG